MGIGHPREAVEDGEPIAQVVRAGLASGARANPKASGIVNGHSLRKVASQAVWTGVIAVVRNPGARCGIVHRHPAAGPSALIERLSADPHPSVLVHDNGLHPVRGETAPGARPRVGRPQTAVEHTDAVPQCGKPNLAIGARGDVGDLVSGQSLVGRDVRVPCLAVKGGYTLWPPHEVQCAEPHATLAVCGDGPYVVGVQAGVGRVVRCPVLAIVHGHTEPRAPAQPGHCGPRVAAGVHSDVMDVITVQPRRPLGLPVVTL